MRGLKRLESNVKVPYLTLLHIGYAEFFLKWPPRIVHGGADPQRMA
jgi:hypothetical protein